MKDTVQRSINTKLMDENDRIVDAWMRYEKLTSDMGELTESMESDDNQDFANEHHKLLQRLWDVRHGNHSAFVQTADAITKNFEAYAEYKSGV